MTRVVASIEARMGSSRLPGKVLMDIEGKPALTRLLERLQRCQRVDEIVLATTDNDTDDVLADWAGNNNVCCYRGSEKDVLNRVVCAHRETKSDIVIEVTGDCPLLDPEVIDMGVDTFFSNNCDVVNNLVKLSFPQGIDLQIFSLSLLEDVEKKIDDPAVREHVSLYFYENPEKYNLLTLIAPQRWYGPKLRFQLDYQEDLEFIRTVYKSMIEKYNDANFGLEEIMNLLKSHPDLSKINAHCKEKSAR